MVSMAPWLHRPVPSRGMPWATVCAMSQNPFDRDEMEALLATHQELGPGMEPALVDSFAQKIIAEVQRQNTEVQRQNNVEQQRMGKRQSGSGGQIAVAVVSLVMAVPLTEMALETIPWMAAVFWIGIVLVNFAVAFGRRRGGDS